ncbi:hypothetical protein V1477_008770 [Vespula maculifrons]|uniref:Uncharacterized protein n=1 Tax=Vespula maculifrons TaxID=7453 RepID=A0ABD2CDZ8_VESMC
MAKWMIGNFNETSQNSGRRYHEILITNILDAGGRRAVLGRSAVEISYESVLESPVKCTSRVQHSFGFVCEAINSIEKVCRKQQIYRNINERSSGLFGFPPDIVRTK